MAYARLIRDVGKLAVSFYSISAALKAIRIGEAIWTGVDNARFIVAISNANDVIHSYRDARDLWNLSALRRKISQVERLNRQMNILMQNWENASCHLYVTDAGRPTIDPADHATHPR